MSKLISSFTRFPKEAAYISSMVAGYGELEFELYSCVAAVIDDDSQAVRILFRVRSEAQRIDIADAILRPKFVALELVDSYSTTIGALRWCRTIRNQYAHCHWHIGNETQLEFFNMEATAQTAEGTAMIKFMPTDAELLEAQEDYFYYTIRWLQHLRSQYEVRAGRTPTLDVEAPESRHPPKKHNRVG